MNTMTALESIGVMAQGWSDATDVLAPIQVRVLNEGVDSLVAGWREAGLDPDTFALALLYGMVQAVALVSAAETETGSSPIMDMLRSIQPMQSAAASTSIIVALACHRFITGTLL